MCQISARKAEITFLTRDFDCIASALDSPFVGWPAQSLAKTQPGLVAGKEELTRLTESRDNQDAGWNNIGVSFPSNQISK